ncbi:unnamed protein product [Cyprideis torosa]|uniref:Lipase domain-containing protein n=1 Tax=Cyprideis torosa TaxID=163714 RepID=A0A7R8W8N1_9CRUS|nr:unnamed protein product [Cyprideis torosa]CAG0883636.1 unnamed protein product [Cyprideis torosa]
MEEWGLGIRVSGKDRSDLNVNIYKIIHDQVEAHRRMQMADLLPKAMACYEEYNLGCYDTSTGPMSEIGVLPTPPTTLDTSFVLFNEKVNGLQASFFDIATAFTADTYDPSLPTVFVTHGFTDSLDNGWLYDIKDAVQGTFPRVNIFLMDWKKGAEPSVFNYIKAAANTLICGRQLGVLATHLANDLGADPSTFHGIGHSLGGHVMSFASNWLEENIGRKFGKVTGGQRQPGCPNLIIGGIEDIFGDADASCSHSRARQYIAESVQQSGCRFRSVACEDVSNFDLDFLKGECSINNYVSSFMGIESVGNGSMYLLTLSEEDDPTFCGQHYRVSIRSSDTGDNTYGLLEVKLQNGDGGTTKQFHVTKDDEKIDSGSWKHHVFIEKYSVMNGQPVQNVIVEYIRFDGIFTHGKLQWPLDQIVIEDGTNTLPTVFVTHGFRDGLSYGVSLCAIKDVVFETHGPSNVILMDWEKGAEPSTFNYVKAAMNTLIVGRQLGVLATHLALTLGADPSTFHGIGHSLGCHVMAFASNWLEENTGRKFGKITALDPANPLFYDGTESDVSRQDKNDANFTVVIHTSSGSIFTGHLSPMRPTGHLDFYPNGGSEQPGCPSTLVRGIMKGLFSSRSSDKSWSYRETRIPAMDRCSEILNVASNPGRFSRVQRVVGDIGCSHSRAWQYIVESVPKSGCVFRAVACDGVQDFNRDFIRGECSINTANSSIMGLRSNGHGKMYLLTLPQEEEPTFCADFFSLYLYTTGQHYRVSLLSSNTQEHTQGAFLVTLYNDSNGQTRKFEIISADEKVEGGKWKHFIFIEKFSALHGGPVTRILVEYRRNYKAAESKGYWSADEVRIEDGANTYGLCHIRPHVNLTILSTFSLRISTMICSLVKVLLIGIMIIAVLAMTKAATASARTCESTGGECVISKWCGRGPRAKGVTGCTDEEVCCIWVTRRG